MNLEQFNSYDEEIKQKLLEEMFRLYTIIEENPISIEELEIFADWHSDLGKFGQNLKDFLTGVYPWREFTYTTDSKGRLISSNIDKYDDAEEKVRLIKMSEESLRFVKFWNDEVHRRLG